MLERQPFVYLGASRTAVNLAHVARVMPAAVGRGLLVTLASGEAFFVTEPADMRALVVALAPATKGLATKDAVAGFLGAAIP